MSRYKAYPAYRDSGVEWVAQMPAGWTNVAIKYMALETNSLFLDGDWIESKDISDGEVRYITTGNVGEGIYKEQGAGFISQEKFLELGCTEVFPGDILISRLNNPIGRACVVPNLGARIVTSVDNVILRPDRTYSKPYLVYLFSCQEYFEHTANLARGATMQRISRGLLGNIRVFTPPKTEQQIISAFLDHETAKIDALIEKQQRLIELLKEKRQAVISHAVTKGLNPNAPMKDSGVEWLGQVPAHWVISPIKYLSNAVGTGGTPKSELSFCDEGVNWFTPGDFSNQGKLTNSVKHVTNNAVISSDAKIFEAGSILVIGIGATLGKVGLCDFDFSCNQQINVISPNEKVLSEFLLYSLMTQGDQMRLLSNFSTIGIMNQEKTKQIIVAVPPLLEQRKMINYLGDRIAQFDFLVEFASNKIELLNERRTALISAAVTGKIDVRDWQPAAA